MTNASLKRAVRTSRYAIQLVALTAAFSFAAVGSASAATVSISGTFLQVSDTSAATNAIVVRNASVGGTNYTLIIDNNFHIITNNTGGVCTHMGSGYVLYCPNPNNGWTLGKTIAFYGGPGRDRADVGTVVDRTDPDALGIETVLVPSAAVEEALS